jgi:hypothetical protein
VRRATSLRSVPHSHDDLWSFIMLPDAPAVSEPSFFSQSFYRVGAVLTVAISRG